MRCHYLFIKNTFSLLSPSQTKLRPFLSLSGLREKVPQGRMRASSFTSSLALLVMLASTTAIAQGKTVIVEEPQVVYKADIEPQGFDISRKGSLVPVDKLCTPTWVSERTSIIAEGEIIRSANEKEQIRLLIMDIKRESRFSSPEQVNQLNTLTRSAAENDPVAMAEIGNRYYDGRGLPNDFRASLAWYVLAADHGSTYAKYILSELYGQGWIVDQDPEISGKWFENAQKQRNALLGMRELAQRYDDHEGGMYDEERAFFWFERAAMNNDVESQLWLGDYYSDYDHPNGIMALRWYGRAAAAQEPQAYYGIAQIYDEGIAIPINYVEAAKWYEKAAKMGLAVAQYHLGEMYAEGRGVNFDPVKAWAWLEVSKSHIDNRTVESLQHNLVSKMLPEQRLPAADLAAQYCASYSGERKVDFAQANKILKPKKAKKVISQQAKIYNAMD